MEITLDKKQKTQGIIKISVIRADFQPSVDQKIKEYSKTVNIKGFRPGKVPQGMIKKMYGNALIVEEINKLISGQLSSYLRDSETQFLGEPIPIQKEEEFDWAHQEVFEFEYEIGFAEPFELKVDRKIKLEKYTIKIDDVVVDETIENLRRQFGKIDNPDQSSLKDMLHGQLSSKDGAIDQEITIDLREVEKSSLKKLVGIKVGEVLELDPKKTFKHENVLKSQLKINKDEFNKLKGKLKFELKGIDHYSLAEVNQELFDKTFGKGIINDESAYRERVKEIVSQSYAREEELFFNHNLKEKIIETTKINLPDEFLKRWLLQSDENLSREVVEEEFTAYSNELKWSLIQNELVKKQNLEVSHEDVLNEARESIRRQFAGSGIGNQLEDQLDTFANNYLQNSNGENYVRVFNEVKSNKILDFIKGEISIKVKEVTLEEFRKL